jgi:antitoxin CptB
MGAMPPWLLTGGCHGLISYLRTPWDVRMTEAREILVKRLRFRSWHRGMREMDLLLGRFADRHLDELSPLQLRQYEALLEVADPDLYNWLMGTAPVPANFDNEALNLIKKLNFNYSTP